MTAPTVDNSPNQSSVKVDNRLDSGRLSAENRRATRGAMKRGPHAGRRDRAEPLARPTRCWILAAAGRGRGPRRACGVMRYRHAGIHRRGN